MAVSLIFAIAIFIAAIPVHEFGHWLLLRRHSPRAKIMFYAEPFIAKFKDEQGNEKEEERQMLRLETGEEKDYMNLNKNQLIKIYLGGILLGASFISVLCLFLMEWRYVIVLTAYLYSCKSDFLKIYNSLKKNVALETM